MEEDSLYPTIHFIILFIVYALLFTTISPEQYVDIMDIKFFIDPDNHGVHYVLPIGIILLAMTIILSEKLFFNMSNELEIRKRVYGAILFILNILPLFLNIFIIGRHLGSLSFLSLIGLSSSIGLAIMHWVYGSWVYSSMYILPIIWFSFCCILYFNGIIDSEQIKA